MDFILFVRSPIQPNESKHGNIKADNKGREYGTIIFE